MMLMTKTAIVTATAICLIYDVFTMTTAAMAAMIMVIMMASTMITAVTITAVMIMTVMIMAGHDDGSYEDDKTYNQKDVPVSTTPQEENQSSDYEGDDSVVAVFVLMIGYIVSI